MKKMLSIFLTLAMMLSLAACGGAGEQETRTTELSSDAASAPESEVTDAATEENDGETSGSETAGSGEESEATGQTNILVAYFSWADNAILAEDVDAQASPSVIPPGNVQQLAGWVQEETGGDLFSIRVTDPYPSDWDECLSRANQELEEEARPELAENVENLDQYDVVFLGYPNWWYGVPMALLSFLEQNDLSGKQVYLFCSHGTGGLANSVEIITEAVPNAEISDDIFDCYEEDAASSQEDIQSWAAGLGYSLSATEESSASGSTESTEPSAAQTGLSAGAETMEASEEPASTARQIYVRFGENTVIYELNDSAAAVSLCEQLPLTVEVEDFSTNEKIFYLPRELNTDDCPVAEEGDGTLAYYAPWGDVVMFYDDYDANPSLFELGHVVSGEELISQMSGTIEIGIADDAEQ